MLAFEGSLAEVRWLLRCQDVELVGRIDPQVHFGRSQAGMAEPESDLPDVAGSLERMKCAGVSQGVRRDGLACDRRHGACRSLGVQGESLGEAASRQAVSGGIQEEMPVGAVGSDSEPAAQRAAGSFHSGRTRPRRPLPRTRMRSSPGACKSSKARPTSSETRRPAL